MRRAAAGLSLLALVAGALTATAPAAEAAPAGRAAAPVTATPRTARQDELPNPLEDKRRALKSAALQQVLAGDASPVTRNGSTVVKVQGSGRGRSGDRYVELARERTDRIFVVLAQFGDQRDPAFPDQDTDPTTPGPVKYTGPLRNQIPKPNRKVDNSTVWQKDYSAKHFRDLYFAGGTKAESLKTYYQTQSSGRYSVSGEVTDWVTVPYNEARYGRSNGYPCDGIVCSNTWALLKDGLTAWVASQKAKGRTQAQITADVKSFDQWDRYDYDNDGNFNEPDGYLDHFQVVHAGGDQADGDPTYGEDAIWSHRWYAYLDQVGKTGPAGNELGGVEIPGTGIWAGDYTVQPENGGLSVFAHEYGHDLGLPDDYDTAGGPSNNTEWWTLMSQSRLNARGEPLGTRPGDIGAWQKLQLGWLNYEVVQAGAKKTIDLGPAEYNTSKPQAAIVALPDKQVTTSLVKPYSGSYDWWSGQGDDYDATLSRSVTLPAGAAELQAQAAWNIEDCGADPCDYAYLEARAAGGDWTAVPGSITDPAEGNGIDGESDGWKPATFDLSAYAGGTVELRFRYVTDGASQGTDPTKAAGLFLDDITITGGGSTLLSDDVETVDPGWTADGFSRATESVTNDYANYYIAANRSYTSYDRYLKTGPYNFGFASKRPDLVEHFPYQQGLLVQYWDTSQVDNNVSVHPGQGLDLVVDAHPKPITARGTVLRNRIQLYDAPFGLLRAASFTLHANGKAFRVSGLRGNPVFDDTKDYDVETSPGAGVKLRGAGVKIRVLKQRGTTLRIAVS